MKTKSPIKNIFVSILITGLAFVLSVFFKNGSA